MAHQQADEQETLDNLPSMIRKIYFKIREQLEDQSHPIIWIIAQFQVAFRHDIEEKLAVIAHMNDSQVGNTRGNHSFMGFMPSGAPNANLD